MSKSQNKGIRNEKVGDYNFSKGQYTKDLTDSEGSETSISKLKRMIIKTINKMKEDMQKQVNEIKRLGITAKRIK
jgi:hypothetical protein